MTPVLPAAPEAIAAPDPVGARIQGASEAAQALQGPLDGTWILRDPAGRPVAVFQIADPAGGGSPAAAWRSARGPAQPMGAVSAMSRTASTLSITFGVPAEHLAVRAVAPGKWRGRLTASGSAWPVTLERN